MKLRAGLACMAKHGALVIAAATFAASARAQDFSILYHERPGQWSLGPDSAGSQNATAKPTPGSVLSFTAFGRTFRARLEPNDVLFRALPQDQKDALRGIDVFRGELVDIPGSWVRLTRADREFTGVIFDGAELFAIDSPTRLAAHLAAPEQAAYTGPIVYRWRDTVGALTDELAPLIGNAAGEAALGTAGSMLAPAVSPGRELDLAVVADTEFSARWAPHVQAGILSRANVVDGIFAFQLGVHLNLAHVTIFSGGDDPFTQAAPASLLAELAEHRAATPEQHTQDLSHLLTGRDLAEPEPEMGRIVGFANRATVCDARLGVAVTQATYGDLTDALIMAHEIAHNLGAPHDGVPGPCAAESTSYLMASTLNGSRQFSTCSIQQMQPQLAAACLDVLAAGDVGLRVVHAPAATMVGRAFEVAVAVDNPSAVDAHGVELSAIGTNAEIVGVYGQGTAFECTREPPYSCRKSPLASGTSSGEIRITAKTLTEAPATLQVQVASLNDPNTANNSATVALGVLPTADLEVEFVPVPTIVRLGQRLDLAVIVRNRDPVAVTNAVARVGFARPLNLVAVSADAGSCMVDVAPYYRCELGDLAPGATRSLAVQVRASDSLESYPWSPGYAQTTAWTEVDADQEVSDPARASITANVVVAEAVADLATTITRPTQFALDAQAEIVLTVANLGPDRAIGVSVQQSGSWSLADRTITANVGNCSADFSYTSAFRCDVSELAAGEALTVTVRGLASTIGQFNISSTAQQRSWDPEPANNGLATYFAVSPFVSQPPANPGGNASTGDAATTTSGGGGGGATGSLALVALILLLVTRLVAARLAAQYSNRRQGGYTP